MSSIEDVTSGDLGAIGVLKDTVDEMRKVSAELRRDSCFTQAELRSYARWRMKKKCAQDGLSQQPGRLKGRATPLPRLKERAVAGVSARDRAAKSAVQLESLAQRANAIAALVKRFVVWRCRVVHSGLSGRGRQSAAAECGQRTA